MLENWYCDKHYCDKLSDTQDKSSLNAITSHGACQTLQVHFKGCTMSAARLFSIHKSFFVAVCNCNVFFLLCWCCAWIHLSFCQSGLFVAAVAQQTTHLNASPWQIWEVLQALRAWVLRAHLNTWHQTVALKYLLAYVNGQELVFRPWALE